MFGRVKALKDQVKELLIRIEHLECEHISKHHIYYDGAYVHEFCNNCGKFLRELTKREFLEEQIREKEGETGDLIKQLDAILEAEKKNREDGDLHMNLTIDKDRLAKICSEVFEKWKIKQESNQ